MSPELETALAECDELGVVLWVSEGKLSFRAGECGFPDRLRDALRSHRDELIALLRDHPVAVPEWVPFVSRNLDHRWFEWVLVKTVPVLFVNQRPYYRLTPSVWVRFCRALDNRAASILSDPGASGDLTAAVDLLTSFREWLSQHYRPDQMRRAWSNPHPLPPLPRVPFVFGTPDEQDGNREINRSCSSVAPRCPTSPKSSRCDPRPSGPTIGPQHTDAATVATGSDCVPWC